MKTKTSKFLQVMFVSILFGFLLPDAVGAAGKLSAQLEFTTMSETVTADNYEQQFILELTPEPTTDVMTTFDTDAQCLLGPANKNYTNGGSIYTKNGSLHFGLRVLDDDQAEGSHTCTISFSSVSETDPDYLVARTLEKTIRIIDNDTEQSKVFSVSQTSTAQLEEGDSNLETYQVTTSIAPTDPIIISATADDQCDLLSSANTRAKSVSKTIRAGSRGPVEFTIVPVEDSLYEGSHQCTILNSASTIDMEFAGIIVPSYSADIEDNDSNPNKPDEREYEDGKIYYKDANNDGIEDSRQTSVTSFINAVTNKRQALVAVDAAQQLNDQCELSKKVASQPYEGGDVVSAFNSSQGSLKFSIHCEAGDARVLWLIDEYVDNQLNWLIYQQDESGNLVKLEYEQIVYDLGEDFTTGVLVNLREQGEVVLIQSLPTEFDEPARLDETSVTPAQAISSGLSIFEIGAILTALSALGWLIYKRFFSDVDTKDSNYPKVDHF